MVDGIGREDAWVAQRMEQHLNPTTPFEVSRQDGMTILVIEQKLSGGGTASVITDITEIK